MPSFITPRTEGERMDLAEVMVEKSRQEVEYKLLNNPVELLDKFGTWTQNLGLAYGWAAQQAARPDASFTDMNVCERHKERVDLFVSAFDELFLTDAGKGLWSLFVDDLANRKAVGDA